MPRLRKFLRGCLANAALIYLMASLYAMPALFRSPLPHPTVRLEHEGLGLQVLAVLLVAFSKLLLAMPLILAVVFGIAWWTLKTGKPSARRWVIGASIAMLLSGIGLMPAGYSMWEYGASAIASTTLILIVASFVVAIAGFVAFGKRDTQTKIAADATSQRVSGDGTHKALDALALILQVGGTLGGIFLYTRWGYARDLPIAHGLESWFQIAVVVLSVTAIHESAHALVGIGVGMKLRAFVVGPFQWRVLECRWTFQFRPTQVFALSGAAGLIPTDPDQSRWKDVAMIAAGPVSNLLTGAVAAALGYLADDRPWESSWEYFALFATISLGAFVVNLIPFRPDALYSDGARIYQLFRSGPMADYHRAVKTVLATLVSPRRPGNYDIEAIQRASAHFTSGQVALLLKLWATSYYFDHGSYAQSFAALAEAERIYHESASDIDAQLCTVFVSNVVFLRRDAAAARFWWNQMQARIPKKLDADYWLAKSALHWVENDASAAREAWDKGDALAQMLPAAGAYDFDRDSFMFMKGLLNRPRWADSVGSYDLYAS